MSKTRRIEPKKKKPFEIFTPEEIANLKIYSQESSDIQDLLNKLTLTMNEGIHNKNIGWHTRMISLIDAEDNPYSSPLEDHHKLELKKSLNRYLETANRLQKEKNGSIESLTLPTSKKTIEKYANVYQNFWDSCVEELFLTFIVGISGKSEQEFQDGLGKSYIYCLFQLQQYTLGKLNLEEDKIAPIQTYLIKTAKHIMELCHLQPPFLLTETEIQEAHLIRDNLFKKYANLNDLRSEYEAISSYSTYIHLRPEIIIEFAQLINYVIQRVEKEAIIDKKLKKNKQPIMDILENKRKELAMTMAFQEKLQISFGTDDYIEALSYAISNQKSKSLPHRILFSYLESQSMQVAYYPDDDVKAPKKIEKLYHSRWRKEYIKLHAHPQSGEFKTDASLNALSECETKDQMQEKRMNQAKPFFKVQVAALVESEKATDLLLPDFVLSYLSCRPRNSFVQKHEETKKPEPMLTSFLKKYGKLTSGVIDHSYDDLFDFFVNKKYEREDFYRLNQCHDAMEFLTRQVDHRAELYALFKITEQSTLFEQCEFTKTTINNFSVMKNLIMGFENELHHANSLKNISPHAKIIIQKYIDIIKESRAKVIQEAEKVIWYWGDRLKEPTSWHFRESGQYDKLKMLIDDLNAILPIQVFAKSRVGEFRVTNL